MNGNWNGQHFNPNLDHSAPNATFSPGEYVASGRAIEEGNGAAVGHGAGRFGRERRTLAKFSAQQRHNDQRTDLGKCDMRAEELSGTPSAGYGGAGQGRGGMKSAMKKGTSGGGAANEMSARMNAQGNRNMNFGIRRKEVV